jgi:serine/threonine-protein kinase
MSGFGSEMTAYSTPDAQGMAAPQGMAKVCPSCRTPYPAEFNVCPRDGSSLAFHDELVGSVFRDSFRIMRVIGEGGMGRVYEAHHTRIPNKRFAIKMLHPEYAREPQVLARFLREAEAAASIASPHVVDVYDVDRLPDGRPYIVGELLEGKELADYLGQSGKLEFGEAVSIARQICRALMAAHAKGVVHRDMKPENVFLTGDLKHPTVKVLDFGISKLEGGSGPQLTRTGMIMGTPSYMSPEQAKGQKVDHRTDIYAVGAILYCMLTGKRPFDGDDPATTLTAVLLEDPPRPRSLNPAIPEPVEAIIQRAMAKNADERPQSMAELDAVLAPFDPGGTSGSAGSGAAEAGAKPTEAATQREHQKAATARPLLLVAGASGAFGAASIIVVMIGAIMRIARGGTLRAGLTSTEAWLLLLGVFLVVLAPAALFARHVHRTIWGNTAKAIDLASRLVPPVAAGLGAYGAASLLIRFLETVVIRHAIAVAWPVWDVLLMIIGFGAAIGTYRLDENERKHA